MSILNSELASWVHSTQNLNTTLMWSEFDSPANQHLKHNQEKKPTNLSHVLTAGSAFCALFTRSLYTGAQRIPGFFILIIPTNQWSQKIRSHGCQRCHTLKCQFPAPCQCVESMSIMHIRRAHRGPDMLRLFISTSLTSFRLDAPLSLLPAESVFDLWQWGKYNKN